ncbi:MAG: DinB family protein [Acidobacteria bacterium]|nr:DinB family protein [Acidobacteriota bacterium]
MTRDYTTLSLAEVRTELHAIARDTQCHFGHLDERQLNWRRDSASWSIAQCFDHLLNANREMFRAIDAATDSTRPRTLWQRVPVLPGVFGRMLIRSQMPETTRKFTAPRTATPASSPIDLRIIERFIAHQHEASARVSALEGRDVARVIMVSPFAAFITYSVLDGCRLLVTHERRHFAQARRVTQDTGFPSSP